MKKTTCLNDQDLILYHYGELSAAQGAAAHLAACPDCAERLTALREDLAQLPGLTPQVDPMAGTRMAARVTERLGARRRKIWLPAFGATAVVAFALVLSLNRGPQPNLPEVTRSLPAATTSFGLEEDMPDIDFLEELELLQNLELLSQIEGV